jgi:hypothetical protein
MTKMAQEYDSEIEELNKHLRSMADIIMLQNKLITEQAELLERYQTLTKEQAQCLADAKEEFDQRIASRLAEINANKDWPT